MHGRNMSDINKELKKIEKLKANREYPKAIDKIRDLLKEEPDRFELLWELADLYFESDKEKTGVSTLRQILKLFPQKYGQVTNFIEEKWRAVKNPNALLWFLWEAKINTRLFDEASQVLIKMKKKDLKNQLMDYDQRIKELEKFKDDSQIDDNDFNLYFYTAILSLNMGNFTKALKLFERIIKLSAKESIHIKNILNKENEKNASDVNFLLMVSQFNLDISNVAAAVDTLLKIPEIDNTKTQSAITILESIQSSDPNNKKVITGLADLNLAVGNIEEAIKWLSKILHIFPTKTDEILQKIEMIKENNPEESKIFIALVKAALNIKNVDDAVENLKKAFEIEKGVTPEILELAEKVKDIFPESNNARFLLIELYQNKNDIPSALEQLQIILEHDGEKWRNKIIEVLLNIVKKDETNFQAHDMLGKIYILDSQLERATAVYDHLWEIHPESLDIVIAGYEGILKIKPSLIDVGISVSKAYILKKNYQDAVVRLGDVLKHNPKKIKEIAPFLRDIIHQDKKQTFLIARLYESLSLKKEVQDDANLALAMAEAYSSEGQLDRATQQLQRVLTLDNTQIQSVMDIYQHIIDDDPTQVSSRLELVNLYIGQNQINEATQELVKIVKTDQSTLQQVIEAFYKILDINDNLVTRRALIETFYNHKLLDHAAEECEKIIQGSPFDKETSFAYLILAETYIEKGLYKDAVDKLFTVLNINTDTLPEVKEKCTRIVGLDQANVSARYALAECNILEESYDKAIKVLLEVMKYDKTRIDSIMEHIQRIIAKKHTNVNAHLALGELYIHKNEFDKASREFSQALELAPNRLEEVIKHQKAILKLDPDSVIANFMLGKALIQKNDFPKAVEYMEKSRGINSRYMEPVMRELQRIIKLDPENPDAKIALGQIYIKKNLYIQAIEQFNQVIESNPQLTEFILPYYEQIQEKSPELLQLHMAMAKSFIAERKYDKAIEKIETSLLGEKTILDDVITLLELIVSREPSLSKAVTLLAECYISKKEYDEASTHLMAALNLSKQNKDAVTQGLNRILTEYPDHLMSRMHLGNMYFQFGDHEKAKKEFDSALAGAEDKQTQIELYLNLSNACLAMGDEKKSKAYLLSARVLDPENQYLYRQLEDLYYRQLSIKIENLEDRVNQLSENYHERMELSTLYLQNWQISKAMESLAFSTSDDSIEPQRLNHLAKLFIVQKNYYTAINILSNIHIVHHNLTTDEKAVLYWLSIAHERVGNFDEAIQNLEKIYACDPNYQDIQKRKSKLYLMKTEKSPTALMESI